jgi:hypothetical protein
MTRIPLGAGGLRSGILPVMGPRLPSGGPWTARRPTSKTSTAFIEQHSRLSVGGGSRQVAHHEASTARRFSGALRRGSTRGAAGLDLAADKLAGVNGEHLGAVASGYVGLPNQIEGSARAVRLVTAFRTNRL